MQNGLLCPLDWTWTQVWKYIAGCVQKGIPRRWAGDWGLPMGPEHQRSTLTTDTMWPDTWHTPVAIPSQKWQAVLKLRDGINPAFLKMLLWDNFVRATQIPSCTMWLFTLARSAPTWSKSALQKGAFPNVVPASLGSSSNWKQKKSDDWRDSDRQ